MSFGQATAAVQFCHLADHHQYSTIPNLALYQCLSPHHVLVRSAVLPKLAKQFDFTINNNIALIGKGNSNLKLLAK